MTKGDLHEYADINHSERNALRAEIDRLTAENNELKKALEQIYSGRYELGDVFDIAREALKEGK